MLLLISYSIYKHPTQGMNVCVCVYSEFVLSCIQVEALQRAHHLSKVSYRLCEKDYETDEEGRAQQRALEPLMTELMNEWNLQIWFWNPVNWLISSY
jgi:hypothetical protein